MSKCASVELGFPPIVPLRIGRHALPNVVLLAPMSGVTDAAFRRLAHDAGAGLVITEMVASEHLVSDKHNARRRVRAGQAKPFVVQLAGCEAHWMSEGARVAEAMGADVIDINMGCPAKEVTGKLSGSALMRDLDHARLLIAAVIGAATVPVTLKMRLGWDHASLNAPELARIAEAEGAQLLTVHARTRCQFFRGEADWSLVRRVKKVVRIPVVVNGDIVDPASARTALDASGADAVMVGRGACGAPWMLGRIATSLATGIDPGDPALAEQQGIAIAHVQMQLEQDGPVHGLRNARKHIAWYLASSGQAEDKVKTWRRRLCTSESAPDVLANLAHFYDQAREAA